jgi:hypothetical protein
VNNKKVTVIKNWTEVTKHIKQTDTFTNIGKALPIRYYRDTGADGVCPLEIKDTKITGYFATGAKAPAELFIENIALNTEIPNLAPGMYLYDFKYNDVIYDYQTAEVSEDRHWCFIPDAHRHNEFDHMIGIDALGVVHKVWHRTNSFAELSYVGHSTNNLFEPGEYKPDKLGVEIVFNMIAGTYGLAEPTTRIINTFIEKSFNPSGPVMPNYTFSQQMLDMVFEPKPINLPGTEIIPFCGYDSIPRIHDDREFWADDGWIPNEEDEYRIMDFIGITDYPKPKFKTDVELDVDLPGLIKATLNISGSLFITYNPEVVQIMDIKEALVLPDKNTFYTPILDMEEH